MPLVSKSFSIDIVPGKTPPTIHVSEKDIGRLYYISIVDDGTPFSIPSGTTAKVEGTIGPYGFSENADVINNTIIVTLRSKMTAIKGKVWTKIKLSNNGDIASTCAFWLDVDKAGAVEGRYIDPDAPPDPGGGGVSLEGFVQYNEPQALSESEKAQARANIGASEVGDELPEVTAQDNGKVLGVVNGQWAIKEDETGDELPSITAQDNGKVLGVVNGQWAIKEDETGDELPEVTAQDNGKVLGVVNGQWGLKDSETGDALPVVTTNDNGKVLGVVDGEWAVKKDDNVIPILYNPQDHTFSVRDLSGSVTGTALVMNYFTTMMADIRLMFVYDWGANIYQLYSVNRSTNEVKFCRRVGNVDTFLTITGNSSTVVESTETISGDTDASSIILTLNSNRQTMNGESTITGGQIKALVESGKTVSIWDAANNRMYHYIGVGVSSRPNFTSVDGGTEYRIAVYDASYSTDETTTNLAVLPPVTVSDRGKVLKVNDQGQWVLGTDEIGDSLPSVTVADRDKVLKVDSTGHWAADTIATVTNALIYDEQTLTDSQLLQSHQNLHLYGSAVGFVYNGSTINAIGKTTGAHTAKMIVDDYFGSNTTLLDKAFLYVIDQNGNVYDLDSVDTTNNIVVFKRRSGNTDYFLTLTGTSMAVAESTSPIGGSNTPFLISLSYNSSTDTWTCNKTAAEILANMGNSMVYYQGYRYYVTSMFNTGGSSATIYYERQEVGSSDGIEEFRFGIQNDVVTIKRYTTPLNLFEIPIVYSNNAWDIDGTKILAGAIYNYYKHCVLVTDDKRIHIVKSFRSEDPQDKYVELIGVEPASDGSDLTIWKLIAEANSSAHASISTYTFSGGSSGPYNAFYYLDGTTVKNSETNVATTGQQLANETLSVGVYPVIISDETGVEIEPAFRYDFRDSGGMWFSRFDGKYQIRLPYSSSTISIITNGYNTPHAINAVWDSSAGKYNLKRWNADGDYYTVGYSELEYHAEGLMLNGCIPVSKIAKSGGWMEAYFNDIQISSIDATIVNWHVEASSSNGVTVTRIVKKFQLTEYYTVTLNADGTVNTRDSSLSWSTISARMSYPNCADYLLITWGNSLFTAKAVEKLTNDDIKFICDVEHDGIQRHMIFTLDGDNILTTTAIETYSLRPVTVWEVTDVSQGLLARNTDISANLNWHLTNLNLAPFKRIKIYSRAGRKTGAIAADSSITPASIIEMSLDDRAKETVSQNVFIGSSIVQNPNDSNRLGLLTCAVSGDKTKFAVVRSTTLYGTAATSNMDAYTYVFKIEGYYD